MTVKIDMLTEEVHIID